MFIVEIIITIWNTVNKEALSITNGAIEIEFKDSTSKNELSLKNNRISTSVINKWY